jgi:hypothetical protein
MGYKYLMNSSSFRFTISSFLTFLADIFFKVYLFKISSYFIFLKWYLLEHLRVPQSIKEDLLQVLITSHPGLLGIRNKLLAIIHNYPIILPWSIIILSYCHGLPSNKWLVCTNTTPHNTSSQYLLIKKETKTCLFTFTSPTSFNHCNL